MGGLLHLIQREGSPPCSPLFAVPNVTAHPSTTSVPITALLYTGPLLYGFNVPIKELRGVMGAQPFVESEKIFVRCNRNATTEIITLLLIHYNGCQLYCHHR